ncbi:hypothetical protein KSD_01660 [Ktedonobacter sp. SOSP1-85]|nr:hypothetical protein KSD_01660 [Ktedonobacter sp. SOSP1-85]
MRVAKARPEDVALATMECMLASLVSEDLADKRSIEVKTALATDPVAFSRQQQQRWDSRAKEKHKMTGGSTLAWIVPDEESGVV